MVRTTLDTILKRLPKLLKDRYGGDAKFFWINAYNDLLTELEATRCGPNNILMVPVPWQLVMSNEILKPQGITDITNLYFSTGGEVKWEVADGGAHALETLPTESEVRDMNLFTSRRNRVGRDILHLNGSGYAEIGDAIIVHSVIGNSQPGEYNPPDAPKASWVISYSPSSEYMGVSGTSVGVPMEAGEYDWPIQTADPSDFYWIFRDYLIVEGHRAYHRIATVDDVTSLPPNWDDLVTTYLRYRGEEQTDQFSKNTVDWISKWNVAKRRWCISHAKLPSSAKKPSRRPSYTPVTSR